MTHGDLFRRLAQCVFHLSVNGELKRMCEVNAPGVRDRYDEQLTASSESARWQLQTG